MSATPRERRELRRMMVELDMVEFTPSSVTLEELDVYSDHRYDTHTVTQGHTQATYNRGCGNAPVYQDIMGFYSPISSARLRFLVRRELDGGRGSVWFGRALDVARLRLSGSHKVHPPIAAPYEGDTQAERDRRAVLLSRYVALMHAQERPIPAYFYRGTYAPDSLEA